MGNLDVRVEYPYEHRFRQFIQPGSKTKLSPELLLPCQGKGLRENENLNGECKHGCEYDCRQKWLRFGLVKNDQVIVLEDYVVVKNANTNASVVKSNDITVLPYDCFYVGTSSRQDHTDGFGVTTSLQCVDEQGNP